MTDVKIPHNTFVLVGDGRKALILRNEGDEVHLNLKVERLFEHENPSTHEQGSDRPGRLNDSLGHKSGIGETDWHNLEEARFAKDVAGRLYALAHDGRFDQLVVVAPPRTLGELRGAMHREVSDRVIAEFDKDMTRHPVADIERLLAAH